MQEMTGVERISNILKRQPVDRIGVFEHFWGDTQRIWAENGWIQPDESMADKFGFDTQKIEKALEKAGNKNFETVEFEGLNHLFQTAKTGNPSEYGQITETFSPTVLDKISSWILSLK